MAGKRIDSHRSPVTPGAKRGPRQRPWPGPAGAKRRHRTQRPPDRNAVTGGMPHRGCPNSSEDWGWIGLWLKAMASSEASAGSGRSEAEAQDIRQNTPSSDDDRVSYKKVAATYSPTWWGSTIGDGELNFSVRNGKRWILTAITATVCF